MNKKITTIALFGASGRTGQAVTAEAALRGIKVRANSKRNPSQDNLSQTIRGVDAVVIVFGPHPPYTDIFCAAETEKIIQTMQKEQVKRLICQTGGMIGDYPDNRSMLFKLVSKMYRKRNPRGYEDRVGQEQAVKSAALDWTLIKPPRLTSADDTKTVHGGEQLKVGLFSSISRKSLARFIIGELLVPRHISQAIFVTN